MTTTRIQLQKTNHVLKIRLNRPEKMNAFDPTMIRELTEAFNLPSTDKNLRVVVLEGEGKSFCSGADLEWMKSMVKFSHQENIKDSNELFDLFEAGRTCPIPIIGRAHGNVMGGALGLLAICDIVAAHKETKFCFSEVKLGLVPAVISPFILAKAPRHLARELMLTAEIFNVEKAVSLGLVHFSGEVEEVEDFVLGRVDFLLSNGPEALRELKKLLLRVEGVACETYRSDVTRVIAERRASSEGQEGLQSFFDKRKPAWKLT